MIFGRSQNETSISEPFGCSSVLNRNIEISWYTSNRLHFIFSDWKRAKSTSIWKWMSNHFQFALFHSHSFHSLSDSKICFLPFLFFSFSHSLLFSFVSHSRPMWSLSHKQSLLAPSASFVHYFFNQIVYEMYNIKSWISLENWPCSHPFIVYCLHLFLSMRSLYLTIENFIKTVCKIIHTMPCYHKIRHKKDEERLKAIFSNSNL